LGFLPSFIALRMSTFQTKSHAMPRWLLWLAPLVFSGCSSQYSTILINNTAQTIVIEAVQKPGAPEPALDIPSADYTACTAQADRYATRQKCQLAPEQVCYLGSDAAYFPLVPLAGDTIIVRTAAGLVRRLTANSVGDFVTDTTKGSLGVAGQPYITYTIRIKEKRRLAYATLQHGYKLLHECLLLQQVLVALLSQG
jgi:hypothetical protein